MSLILALDQSTSATKAILFSARGKVLDRASRNHRQIYPQPGWVEHDAEEIWRNVLAVVGEIAKRNHAKLNNFAALSITNQRETVLVFDRKTGKPLHNALVWQDRRGDAICSQLSKQGHGPSVLKKTGLRIDTYFSASKVRWLIENKPAIAAKLKSGDAVIGTIDTYLIHRLTGGNVFAADFTNASRTLLFDIGKLRWDAELCRLFRVPMRALPEVRESAAQYGETDANGILPQQLPIIGVMGDSQASLFAQRCYQPGTAKATFGTGTSVLLNIGGVRPAPGNTGCQPVPSGNLPDGADEAIPTLIPSGRSHTSSIPVGRLPTGTGRLPVLPNRTGAVTALAWVWQGKPAYALEGLINFSAATIEWLKNQLGLIQSASEVGKLATSVADNGGVYLVPAFAGLSAPYWSPDARAAIVGMTAHTRKEHVVRAAQEAIAYQIRDVLDLMRANAGRTLQSVAADGGPTRNQFLMQFTADITGTELQVSDVAESSAWGAAMAAFLGLGLCKSLDDLSALPRTTRVFRPQMDRAKVKQLHDGWLAAVKRVL